MALISYGNDFCSIHLENYTSCWKATNACKNSNFEKFWDCPLYKFSRYAFNQSDCTNLTTFQLWETFWSNILHLKEYSVILTAPIHGINEKIFTEKGCLQNFSWFYFFFKVMHDYVHWHCSIDNHVK